MKIKNKKVVLTVLGILIVLLSVIGITYAYFSAKITEKNKTETVIKTNNLNIAFTGTQEINCSNIVPGDSCIKKFTVENTSNVPVTYNIYMEGITNEFNEDLVYTLEDETGSVVAETPLPVTNKSKSYLKTNISIEASKTKTYTLKVLYKYLETSQDNYQGKTFKATVGVDTELVDETYSMYGTVYKNKDNNKILVTEGNLVFFSEHQDVTITSDGKFEATNLETGNHEVYYMGNIDASNLSKEEIKNQALCTSTFKMATSKNEIVLDCKNNDNYSLDDIEIKKEPKTVSFSIEGKDYEVEEGTTWMQFISSSKKIVYPIVKMDITDKSDSNKKLAKYEFNTYLDNKYQVLTTSEDNWLKLLNESVPNLSKKYKNLGISGAGIGAYNYDNLISFSNKVKYKFDITVSNVSINKNSIFATGSVFDQEGNEVKTTDVIKPITYNVDKPNNTVLNKIKFNLLETYNGYTEDYYECDFVSSFKNGGPTSGNIYYSEEITYENGTYSLVNPKLFTIGSDNTTLIGKFSTFNNSSTSSSYIFRIGSLTDTGSIAEYYVLTNGKC